MKKQLFLTAVAALAMVSCSEENVLDTNRGNAIDFRAAMGTRAQETTTANMSSIYVTALNARNETPVASLFVLLPVALIVTKSF